jgi:hypothetical protein
MYITQKLLLQEEEGGLARRALIAAGLVGGAALWWTYLNSERPIFRHGIQHGDNNDCRLPSAAMAPSMVTESGRQAAGMG